MDGDLAEPLLESDDAVCADGSIAPRPRPPFGREAGQVLILFTLLLPILLGMAGLVVDVGNAFAERRSLQKAADAAALAAAQDPAHAHSIAQSYSAANGGPAATSAVPAGRSRARAQQGVLDLAIQGRLGEGRDRSHEGRADAVREDPRYLALQDQGSCRRTDAVQHERHPGDDPDPSWCDDSVVGDHRGRTHPEPASVRALLLGPEGMSMNGTPSEIRVVGADIISNGGISTSGHPKVSADKITVHGSVSSGGVYTPTPTQSSSLFPDPLAYLPTPSFNDQVVPSDAPATGPLAPGTLQGRRPERPHAVTGPST